MPAKIINIYILKDERLILILNLLKDASQMRCNVTMASVSRRSGTVMVRTTVEITQTN